jgi:hypothetical protein
MSRSELLSLTFTGSFAAALSLTLALCIAGSAIARERPRYSAECSNKSLHGSFGMKFDGASANLGRFGSVSVWAFDGAGNFTASESYNADNTGPGTRTIAGTYTVADDCTFGLEWTSGLGNNEHPSVGACVLVDQGNEVYCTDMDNGWVATGAGKKIATPFGS